MTIMLSTQMQRTAMLLDISKFLPGNSGNDMLEIGQNYRAKERHLRIGQTPFCLHTCQVVLDDVQYSTSTEIKFTGRIHVCRKCTQF